MRSAILFVVCAVLLSACCAGPTFEEEKEEAKRDAEKMLDAYCKAVSDSGLAAEFRYLDSSSEFRWMPPSMERPMNFTEVRNAINANARSVKKLQNSYVDRTVVAISHSLVTYHAKLRSVSEDTAGRKLEIFLLEFGLVVKRDDGWKLLSGRTTVLNGE